MNDRSEQLNVFLDAIQYETRALETLTTQLEYSPYFDDAYRTMMDAYALLRNLRADIVEKLEAPRVMAVHASPPGTPQQE